MKAIVLTCDKYHPFADHMMQCYMYLWPDNPFTFLVPYQNYPFHLKKKYGNKINLIPSTSDIKSTLVALLRYTEGEEWIYWCMDDRYPVELDTELLINKYHWIKNMDHENVSGILYTYSMSKYTNSYVRKQSKIYDSDNMKYVELVNYSHFWYHQFMKSKILARFTECLPDSMQQAKQMDAIKDGLTLPGNNKRFVSSNRLASFGESTNRGKITLNCVNSMEHHHIDVPSGFPILHKEIMKGAKRYERSLFYYRIRGVYRSLMGIRE